MKNILYCTCSDTWRDHGVALLRVVTGFAFFYHGYDKVFNTGMAGVADFFASVGIPFAELSAYLVAYGELLGGIALMLGLFTHWVAKLDVVIMLGAIGFVHWANGYNAMNGGYEYQLLLLAASIFFVVSGPGPISLDARRAQKEMLSH